MRDLENRSRFVKFLIALLLTLLTVCFLINLTGCTTIKVESSEAILPEKYTELSVTFEDRPDLGGSFLTYTELRKLIFNIQNMRDYEARLEAVILGDSPLAVKGAE